MTLPTRLPHAASQPAISRPALPIRSKGPAGVVIAIALATLWLRPGLIVIWCGLVGLRCARRWSRQRASARNDREELVRELPGVLALLRLAAASGHGPRDAIRIAASAPDGPSNAFFSSVSERLRGGADLHAALWYGAHQPDAGLVRLLNVLERADRDGLSLVPHLEQLGDDLQRSRLAALENASQRAAVALLFPLVLCILPAFLFLSLLPLLFSVVSNLSI